MLTEVTVTEPATTATAATATAAIAAAAAAAAQRRLMKTNPIDIDLPSTDATDAAAAELSACLNSELPAAAGAGAATAVGAATTVATVAAAPSNMQRIFNFVFRRAHRADARDDGTRDSQRSHVGLLQTFWRAGGRGGQQESPFAAQHRLKGIRCSGSGKNAKQQHATLEATINL